MKYNWQELKKMKSGTVLEQGEIDGVQYLIMRGTGSLTAYLGVSEDHPLANKDYDEVDLACHGGLTFCGKGDGEYRPTGFYWYGWDYAHLGDVLFFDSYSSSDRQWLLESVKADVEDAIPQFKELMKIAESNKEYQDYLKSNLDPRD